MDLAWFVPGSVLILVGIAINVWAVSSQKVVRFRLIVAGLSWLILCWGAFMIAGVLSFSYAEHTHIVRSVVIGISVFLVLAALSLVYKGRKMVSTSKDGSS